MTIEDAETTQEKLNRFSKDRYPKLVKINFALVIYFSDRPSFVRFTENMNKQE